MPQDQPLNFIVDHEDEDKKEDEEDEADYAGEGLGDGAPQLADYDVEECVLNFAKEIIGEVAHKGATQAGVNSVLKLMHKHLGGFFTDALKERLPSTFMGLEYRVGLIKPKSFTRHFCPNGCRQFEPDNDDDRVCGMCELGKRFDNTGKATAEVLYFDLADWITTLLSVEEFADATAGWRDRAAGGNKIKDSIDGTLLKRILYANVSDPENTWPFEQCNDGVVKYIGAGRSFTPVCFHCHALPKHIRTSFGCTFLAAVIPKKINNYQLTLKPIVEMFARLQPAANTPLELLDVYGVHRKINAVVAWIVNDLKDTSGPMCAKQSPAYCGACIQCQQTGIRLSDLGRGSTYYPGFCTFLPLQHPVRDDFAVEFADIPVLADKHTVRRPNKMNHNAALASGRRVLNQVLTAAELQMEAYHGVDVYSILLNYWDKIVQIVNDPMHEIVNSMKDIFRLIGSFGQMKFSEKRRELEKRLGRFEGLGPRGMANFHCSKKVKDAIDALVPTLRLPSQWAGPKSVFAHLNTECGSAEALLLAGPVGVYLLQLTDVETEHKALFIDLCFCLERLQWKEHTMATVAALRTDLIEVLAKLEILLPIYWCTIVRHVLLHLCDFIVRCGPFSCHNMLTFERWHTVFKKLARGTTNVLVSCYYSVLSSSTLFYIKLKFNSITYMHRVAGC